MKSIAWRLCAALALILTLVWAGGSSVNASRAGETESRARAKEWFGPWTSLRAWRESVHKDLEAGRPISPERFDELFDDSFFGDSPDPFALIEGFDRHFRSLLDEPEREAFGRSWRGWHRDRIGLGDVKTRVTKEGEAIVLSFDVPGLDSTSVKLDVARGRVRLSYEARSVEEKTDAEGRVVSRSESSSRFAKVVPVPAEADPDKYRVEKKGETIRLIFESRPGGLKI